MRNRTKNFSARLNEQEYETLNKAIAKTGLTKSAFIRTVARGYLPKPRPPNGYDEMMSELTDIATNIYSISNGTFNIHKVDTEFLRGQAERLDKVILQINTLFTVPVKIKGGDIKWQQQKYGT
ncbi:MAG: ribbon-helix-helix protein, CopG family [Clostridia bacterium]|nr:ribbon-helix-helix protein, CopG family [Clostridia bacterium]